MRCILFGTFARHCTQLCIEHKMLTLNFNSFKPNLSSIFIDLVIEKHMASPRFRYHFIDVSACIYTCCLVCNLVKYDYALLRLIQPFFYFSASILCASKYCDGSKFWVSLKSIFYTFWDTESTKKPLIVISVKKYSEIFNKVEKLRFFKVLRKIQE